MINTNFKTLAIIAMSVLITACGGTAGIETTGNLERSGQFSDTVLIQNTNLAQKVEVVEARAKWVGNIMKAQVTIHNKSYDSEPYQYKFRWFDAEGYEVEQDTSNWSSKVLHGQATETLNEVAPNTTVQQFKMIVRQK